MGGGGDSRKTKPEARSQKPEEKAKAEGRRQKAEVKAKATPIGAGGPILQF
jgi:hypothetical protein